MAIPLPNLDDRRWTDLVEEAQALIPFYAPSWTDHNAHDPGITIVDLLAWLAETDVYRLNQVPDRHRRKFVALAGTRPLGPRPAVTLAHLDPISAAATVPAWTEAEATDAYGVRTPFRTTADVTVVATAIAALQVHHGDRYRDLTASWNRGEPIALLGDDPGIGTELYVGFSEAPRPGVWITLAIAVEGAPYGSDERRRLQEEILARAAACRTPPALLHCPPIVEGVPETPDVSLHHSARTVWEIAAGSNRWRPLEARDDTRALTLTGTVQLRTPATMTAVAVGEIASPYYYLRCRLAAGRLDAAPVARALVVNGVWIEQVAPPLGSPRTPDGKAGLVVARGTGLPEEQLALAEPPIVEESVSVETVDASSGTPLTWARRDDFDASSPTDAHFVLDSTAGTVTFGDGAHGRTVDEGVPITVQYLTTRGEAGNLPRDTVLRIAGEVGTRLRSARTALPATGGRASEDVEDAEGRAFEDLATSERAITAEDYERGALDTPGTRIARAIALPNRHPRHPCIRAPGMITMVIVPHLPAKRPVPTCELRAQVRRHLDRWRLLGTRVEVVGPSWVEVGVRADVAADAGVDRAALAVRITATLDAFFDPLSGGPDGTGWPLGRDVYRAEVLQVIDDVPGVDHVNTFALVPADGVAVCGNLCVPWTGLVAVRPHEITVG